MSEGQVKAEALSRNVFDRCKSYNEACQCYQELLKRYDKRLISQAWKNCRFSNRNVR